MPGFYTDCLGIGRGASAFRLGLHGASSTQPDCREMTSVFIGPDESQHCSARGICQCLRSFLGDCSGDSWPATSHLPAATGVAAIWSISASLNASALQKAD